MHAYLDVYAIANDSIHNIINFMQFYLKDFQAFISLRANAAGDALEVKSLCLEHNHEVSQVCSHIGLPASAYLLLYRNCLTICLNKDVYLMK